MFILLQNLARALLSTGFGKGVLELFTGRKITAGNQRGSSVVLMLLLAVVFFQALAESISRRAERERGIRECWAGRSRPLAAVLALTLGFAGVHRFYMRCIVTGILQCLGTAAFVAGAWMLGRSDMIAFLMLEDQVSIGLFLFLGGLATQLWHVSDFFKILFGGMIPKRIQPAGKPRES